MVTRVESVRPRLRSDIIIEQQRDGRSIQYLIVDPVHNRYWQCGPLQYRLLTLLNGELARDEIVARYSEQMHTRLRTEQVDEVLRRLDSYGLLVQSPFEQSSMQPVEAEKRVSHAFQWQDAVSRRWRMYSADRLLRPLEPITRWLFTPVFLVVSTLLILSETGILLAGGWQRGILPFWSGLYLSPSLTAWVRLIVVMTITGVLHECSHALTLLHFKRKPGFFGLGVSLLGGLFFYVEISEIWFLSTRRQRVLVSLAGPLTSYLIGAVGAVAWWMMPRSWLLSPWAMAFMAVGCLTALYNCLPFFRTDGYFVLSDWLRIPNLDRKARACIQQTLLRRFRRQAELKPGLPLRQHMFLAAYGVIASLVALWFVLIVIDFCSWLIVTVVRHL